MSSSASGKENMFTEIFSENSSLQEWGVSLPGFPSRTNCKLHFANATPELLRKFVSDHDYLKVSVADCMQVVALKSVILKIYTY